MITRAAGVLILLIVVSCVSMTTTDDQDPSVVYSDTLGHWVHWVNSSDPPSQLEASLGIPLPSNHKLSFTNTASPVTYHFEGTRINLLAFRGNFNGTMNVNLDGADYSVSLAGYPDIAPSVVVWASNTFTDGSHSLTISKTDNDSLTYINIDSFQVFEDPGSPSSVTPTLTKDSSTVLQPTSLSASPPVGTQLASSGSNLTKNTTNVPPHFVTISPTPAQSSAFTTSTITVSTLSKETSPKRLVAIAGSVGAIAGIAILILAFVLSARYREKRRHERAFYGCSEKSGASDSQLSRDGEVIKWKLDPLGPPPYPGASSSSVQLGEAI